MKSFTATDAQWNWQPLNKHLLEEICIRIMAINPPNDHLGEDKLGGLNRMVTSLRSACQLPGYQEQENLEIDQCRKSTC